MTNLNLQKKLMAESEMCWAACIDMVAGISTIPSYGLQNQLLLTIRSSGYSGKSITDMPNESDYYVRLFNESILNNKGCSQYQSSNFPDEPFIMEKIDSSQPLILSAVYYPLYMNADTLHVFLVQGYYQSNNKVFWLLAIDPQSYYGTYKVAWIYNEFVKMDGIIRYSNYPEPDALTKIDIVTDIGVASSNGFYDTTFIPSMPIVIVEPEYTLDNLRNLIPMTQRIISENDELINSYFNLVGVNLMLFSNAASYTNVPSNLIDRYNSIFGTLKNLNTWGKIYFYPAFYNGNVVLEFVYFELEESKLVLIAIQEPYGIQEIGEASIYFDNQIEFSFKFNHEEPNYEIINVSPYNYIFLKIKVSELDDAIFLVPIKNYEILQAGRGYSDKEIAQFFQLKNGQSKTNQFKNK